MRFYFQFFLLVMGFPNFCFCQNFSSRATIGARRALESLIEMESIRPYKAKPKLTIDNTSAVKIAETEFLKRYETKKSLLSRQPYEVYLISNYWFVAGTRRKPTLGEGTITGGGPPAIFIDSSNGKVAHLYTIDE